MIDTVLEFARIAGAGFVFLVVLLAAGFLFFVAISPFRSTRRGQRPRAPRISTALAARRFLHIFATEWRLYDFVGWITDKLSRKKRVGFSGTLKKGTLIRVHRREFVPIVPKGDLLLARLDEKTCGWCRGLDGQPITTEVLPPFSECTNEDGCRCLVVGREDYPFGKP